MQALKIRFLQGAANSRNAYKKGGVYTLPFQQARSFIRSGIAIPEVERKIQKQIKDARETRNIKDKDSSDNRATNRKRSVATSEGGNTGGGGANANNKPYKKRKATRRKTSK